MKEAADTPRAKGTKANNWNTKTDANGRDPTELRKGHEERATVQLVPQDSITPVG